MNTNPTQADKFTHLCTHKDSETATLDGTAAVARVTAAAGLATVRRGAAVALLAALAIATVIGCSASTKHVPNVGADHIFESAQGPAPIVPYRLQAGDQLDVKFYRNPELDQSVVVRPDGKISLPYVDEVDAAGLTPAELDANLTRAYTGELATPDVTVIVTQFAGQRVYIGGEVGKQGVVTMTGVLTAYQAIQEAGGFLPTAHRGQVVLIRRGTDGRLVSRTIDMNSVEQGAQLENDVYLAPYDVVWVPRSAVADVDLFVDQYIRGALPIVPGFAVTP